MNNGTLNIKSPKNQNRKAALGRTAIKLLGGGGGGALTSLWSINPRSWFCFGPSDKKIKQTYHTTKQEQTIRKH